MQSTMSIKSSFIYFLLLFFNLGRVEACQIDVSDYVGWSIIYSGTVTGYVDDNGKEKDEFEGCDYGRTLIVDYSKQVICQSYGYSYAYNPDIVVLSNGNTRKACINDDIYDIR